MLDDWISRQMSKASLARTAESRKQAGAKAWQTRLKNLRRKLADKKATLSPVTKAGE